MSSVSLQCASNTYQSIKAVITQRAKWYRVIAGIGEDGTQPPAETRQASRGQRLPHSLLKMFDSRRRLAPMTFLCAAVVWSRCVNMAPLPVMPKWNRHLKGTSVHCIFKQTGTSFKILSKRLFQTEKLLSFFPPANAPLLSAIFEGILNVVVDYKISKLDFRM